MVIYLAPFVMLVGLLLWALPTPGWVKTLGLACFTAGLAASLVLFGGTDVAVRQLPHR